MVEVGRDLWDPSGPTPQQSHTELSAQDCVHVAFVDLQGLVSTISPSFIFSANLLREYSAPSSRPLMMFNGIIITEF